jgi:aryl-alcohol dehydrogenase-like predicted oxidoreductase
VYGFSNAKFGQSSEQMLGRLALKAREEGGAPVIGSKVFTVPWTNVIMGGGLRLGRESLIAALKGSVERTGGPLDLWSIHFPFPGMQQSMLMDTLSEAVDLGLAKAVGVSNYNVGQLEEAHGLLAAKGIPLASNQIKFSLLDRSAESSGMLKVTLPRAVPSRS